MPVMRGCNGATKPGQLFRRFPNSDKRKKTKESVPGEIEHCIVEEAYFDLYNGARFQRQWIVPIELEGVSCKHTQTHTHGRVERVQSIRGGWFT